jgi:hypothetical protein
MHNSRCSVSVCSLVRTRSYPAAAFGHPESHVSFDSLRFIFCLTISFFFFFGVTQTSHTMSSLKAGRSAAHTIYQPLQKVRKMGTCSRQEMNVGRTQISTGNVCPMGVGALGHSVASHFLSFDVLFRRSFQLFQGEQLRNLCQSSIGRFLPAAVLAWSIYASTSIGRQPIFPCPPPPCAALHISS